MSQSSEPGLRLRIASAARRRSYVVLQVCGLALGIGAWELVGAYGTYSWLPPAHEVFARVGQLFGSGELGGPLLDSVHNLVIGFSISVALGLVVGGLMATNRYVDYALRSYVSALMATPSILLVPILYIIFGLSSTTLIAVIVLYASVFIIASTRLAISQADQRLNEMAAVFGAHRIRIFVGMTLRSAGPDIFAGLRLGLGRAVKGMFNGELLIAVTGLAALEKRFEGAFDTAGVLAIAVVVIVLAVTLGTIIEVVNRAVNGWAYTS